jgi:Ca2+-binding EF-hand superfamily protein
MMQRGQHIMAPKPQQLNAEEADKLFKDKLSMASTEVRTAFRKIDQDQSGSLDHAEFRRMLSIFNIEMNDTEFRKMIGKYDPDNNGVCYREFIAAFASEMQASSINGGGIQKLFEGQRVMEEKRQKESHAGSDSLIQSQLKDNSIKKMPAWKVDKLFKEKIALMTNEVRKAFRKMDADNSGVLEHNEIREMLAHMNLVMSDEEFKKLMLKYDPDNNGIDYREFIGSFAQHIKGTSIGGIDSKMRSELNPERR